MGFVSKYKEIWLDISNWSWNVGDQLLFLALVIQEKVVEKNNEWAKSLKS